MFNCTEELYRMWCDGEPLNMRWSLVTVGCSDMGKNTFFLLFR